MNNRKNKIIEEQIELFFFDPLKIQKPNKYGVLHLLRRDIYSCLGYSFEPLKKERESIIWPAAMTIFAGIDLLAKFYDGDDLGSVGTRFKKYCKEYIEKDNAEIIWKLRNSMLHSSD